MITIQSPDARFADGETYVVARLLERSPESDVIVRFVKEQLQEHTTWVAEGCDNPMGEFAIGLLDEEWWKPDLEPHRLRFGLLGLSSDHPLSGCADKETFVEELWFRLERQGENLTPHPLTTNGRRAAKLDVEIWVQANAEISAE